MIRPAELDLTYEESISLETNKEIISKAGFKFDFISKNKIKLISVPVIEDQILSIKGQ